jgi:nicotinamide riboside kinase
MNIKLAVGGSHSTGKSTFLARIRQELTSKALDFQTVSDLATKCPLPILRDHTIESTLWIVATGIAEEIAAAHQSRIVLVDRPVADAWAYLKATGRNPELTSPPGMTLQSTIEQWMPSYNLVYLSELDDSIAIENDKNRDLDTTYRRTVALEMESSYKRFALEYRRLTTKNVDFELDFAVRTIQETLQGLR